MAVKGPNKSSIELDMKNRAWHVYREDTNFLKSPEVVFFTALKLQYTQKLFLYSLTKYLRYGWEGWLKKPPHPLF